MSAADGLAFRAVAPADGDAFEALFEARGGPKYCWCMVFRGTPDAPRAAGPAEGKAEMRRRILAGEPTGILAYDGDEPAGWCSVAPVGSFRRLGPGVETEGREGVWALTCFFVPRRRRGAGLSRRLLDAAIARAREAGAHTLEAYPVAPDSPSYRFLGVVPLFRAAGFAGAGRAGARRHVMRLAL